MDPLSGMDQTADVYIINGKIVEVRPVLENRAPRGIPACRGSDWMEFNAAGMLVAPGFVDIHAHEGILEKTMEAFALDGVTTMIGGNCGSSLYPLDEHFNRMDASGILINFASYVGANSLRELAGVAAEFDAATPAQILEMVRIAEQEMRAGALGVSFGIQYQPGAGWEEILTLGQAAARHGGLTAAHSRDGGVGQSALDALDEMIRLARETGIPHQYSHIGSMLGYGGLMAEALDRIRRARADGISICADVYPYVASMASINAVQLDEGVFDRFACEPEDLEVLNEVVIDGQTVMEAGERFESREQYEMVRQATMDGRTETIPLIIAYLQDWDELRLAMKDPHVCICSDGAVYADQTDPEVLTGHPRVAGSRARWLGRFVREEGLCDLMTGIFKASTLPALILGLEGKGRIKPGADADLVVFDPESIIDRAKYGPDFLTPPTGIEMVMVGGEPAVVRGAVSPGIPAGRTIRRNWKIPGY